MAMDCLASAIRSGSSLIPRNLLLCPTMRELAASISLSGCIHLLPVLPVQIENLNTGIVHNGKYNKHIRRPMPVVGSRG